jgi:hypothetical protein
MKILGRKTGISKKLGYKIGGIADKLGRKALSTIDVVAPIAATAMPEFAPAILAGQAAAHGADRAIRSGVSVANPRQGESRAGNMIQFGADMQGAQRANEKLKKQTELLRQ